MSSNIEAGAARVEDAARQRSVRNPWVVFAVLAMIEFMSVMDSSVVNIALPTIRAKLAFSPTTIAWVVDGYLIGFTGFLLLAGRAADFVGRRRMFLSGVLIFTLFSLACAGASQAWELTASRVLQGFGAALVTPAALALITDIFAEGPRRNRALGIFSSMAGVAAPIGLVLGGLLTSAAWQWIFLINIPIGLAVFAAGVRLLPRTTRQAEGGIDVIGAVAATGGMILLVLATVRGGAQGWTSAATLGEYAGAVVLVAVFLFRQSTAKAPLVPVALLRLRTIALGNVIFVLVGTILISTFFIITLYLQTVRGYDSTKAALIYLPVPIAMLTGTMVAPRAMKFGPHNVLMAGLVVQAAALAGWAVSISDHGSILVSFVIPSIVWAFGLGLSIVSSFVVCTMGLTGQVAGAAAGLATATYQAGGALGLAILAVVAASHTASVVAAGHPVRYALVAGYSYALWAETGVAVVGALLTRALISRRGAAQSAAPTASPAEQAG